MLRHYIFCTEIYRVGVGCERGKSYSRGREGMLTMGVPLRSTLAGQLGGRLERVGGGTAGSASASECCNMLELEFVRERLGPSRLPRASLFEKTLLGPKTIAPAPALLIFPKLERSPVLLARGALGPPATAQPSGPICEALLRSIPRREPPCVVPMERVWTSFSCCALAA